MPHIPDHHADHDRLLVAAYAAGDATGADLDQAISLVAACPECAELHRDLRAIASALPDLPPPARSRDFRLTPGQAAALRPAGWRRWLAPLAGPRFSFAAPMGTGLATLGIAGLLLAGALGAPAAADLAAGGTAAQAMPESSAIEAPAEIPAASPDVAGGEAPGSPGMLLAPAASPATDTVPDTAGGGAVGPEGPGAAGSGGVPGDAGSQERDGQPRYKNGATDARAELAAPSGEASSSLEALALLVLASGLGMIGLRLAARRIA